MFLFTVANVPVTDFYDFDVADHRGATFTHQDMESYDWAIGVTLMF